MYYTTPIYQFRMKCHLCTNHWIIKTDPGNLDYVIVEGATRQERRWDPTDNGQVGVYLIRTTQYRYVIVESDAG
jgi:coiled-coil domain-containing protein 130